MNRLGSIARACEPWLWPLLLMAAIFALSAQRDLTTGLGALDLIARKIAHAFEFGLLFALWDRALRTALDPRRALPIAVAIALVYAGLDEWHQTFVSGRVGSPLDVAIDAIGIAVAVLLTNRLTTSRAR